MFRAASALHARHTRRQNRLFTKTRFAGTEPVSSTLIRDETRFAETVGEDGKEDTASTATTTILSLD